MVYLHDMIIQMICDTNYTSIRKGSALDSLIKLNNGF